MDVGAMAGQSDKFTIDLRFNEITLNSLPLDKTLALVEAIQIVRETVELVSDWVQSQLKDAEYVDAAQLKGKSFVTGVAAGHDGQLRG